MNLSMMYVIHSLLVAVKKEMSDKGLTFDEVLEYYEQTLEQLEKAAEHKRRKA